MASDRTVGDFPIRDKILLITGGGSGIGLAFTRQFHARGGRVLIGDLKLTADAEAFLRAAEAARPGSTAFQRCDVADWRGLHALVSAAVRAFGAVPDVYCPCAGIFEPPWSNFWDDTEDAGYATVRIDAEHPAKLTRLAFRALLGADKKGVVLLVSSVAGLVGTYGCPLYCMAKHAVVGLCKSLGEADEAQGVKVVCICPHLVATPLWEDRDDDRAETYKYNQESTHKFKPDEIAEVMVKLVEEGKYSGGTVYMKAPQKEEVVHEHDPTQFGSNIPNAALEKERGKKWNMDA